MATARKQMSRDEVQLYLEQGVAGIADVSDLALKALAETVLGLLDSTYEEGYDNGFLDAQQGRSL